MSDNTIGSRKARHLEICTRSDLNSIQSDHSSGFDHYRYLHRSLPESDFNRINLSTLFCGVQIKLPLMISCMTGGSDQGFLANKDLAAAAQQNGIPIGTGSVRVLLKNPELLPHFQLKTHCPDVPLVANIGAVQLLQIKQLDLAELLKKIDADALAIHLNPGQEFFQPDGDHLFTGVREALKNARDHFKLPLLIKETGFGIHPQEVADFLDQGFDYIDIAGSGGTNWVMVESFNTDHRNSRTMQPLAKAGKAFKNWGYPTSLLLSVLKRTMKPEQMSRIIASGGIRSGLEAAKAVTLGAGIAASALPFIRAWNDHGREGIIHTLDEWQIQFRAAMALTGCRNIRDLQAQSLVIHPGWQAQIESFLNAF